MGIGHFVRKVNSEELLRISKQLLGIDNVEISQVCERYGSKEEDVRYYEVYYVLLKDKQVVLKKTLANEVEIYQTYFASTKLNVPKFYGSFVSGNDYWICIEYIKGFDLRDMTDELAIKAADSLSAIQNRFWTLNIQQNNCSYNEIRFITYWKRINKRANSIADNLLLREAYQMFLDRQLTCPTTLSNGDFLEWNAIYDGANVTIIDWGYGGIMPYSLDIARFIAHATDNRCTFPFYMNDHQKKLFVDSMYENLHNLVSREQFDKDIRLALLNEYIEFVEAIEDEDHFYYDNAIRLAKSLVK